jgi:hypothetical protein
LADFEFEDKIANATGKDGELKSQAIEYFNADVVSALLQASTLASWLTAMCWGRK